MRGPQANSRSSSKLASSASSHRLRRTNGAVSILFTDDQALGLAGQHVAAVRGGLTARPVRPQHLHQVGAVVLH